MNGRAGILGGTFDPIHAGHLGAALIARAALSLDRLLVIPSRTPPHRSVEPTASGFHRFAMASLAASDAGAMMVSDLELRREGPSYTSTTLECLHAGGLEPSQLFFILGADAFAEIASWHDYPRLLDLSNFVVVSRPGFEIPHPESLIPNPESLVPDPQSPIPDRRSTSVFFIEANTPDVSSTDIRRRVGAGESIDGLVPGSVADHIRRHRLYQPASVAAML